uniref:Uncharacterized protein n=3 Tax=Oryza TaxID=4527 RepID=Q6H539_ORYSJ|nr:hypothetical protein [Oryza sativa Japonica Group]
MARSRAPSLSTWTRRCCHHVVTAWRPGSAPLWPRRRHSQAQQMRKKMEMDGKSDGIGMIPIL